MKKFSSLSDLGTLKKNKADAAPASKAGPVSASDQAAFHSEMKRLGLISARAGRIAPAEDADAEESLFAKEMQRTGVVPLDTKKYARATAPVPPKRPQNRELVETVNAKAQAQELDDTYADYPQESYVHFSAGTDVLDKLRRGAWPVADRIDLHGLHSDEAKTTVVSFLRQSYEVGLRCVLIVHGRGLNSPEGPVLKPLVRRWASQLPFVLAYTDGGPNYGADGAVLVLLAKRKGTGL